METNPEFNLDALVLEKEEVRYVNLNGLTGKPVMDEGRNKEPLALTAHHFSDLKITLLGTDDGRFFIVIDSGTRLPTTLTSYQAAIIREVIAPKGYDEREIAEALATITELNRDQVKMIGIKKRAAASDAESTAIIENISANMAVIAATQHGEAEGVIVNADDLLPAARQKGSYGREKNISTGVIKLNPKTSSSPAHISKKMRKSLIGAGIIALLAAAAIKGYVDHLEDQQRNNAKENNPPENPQP